MADNAAAAQGDAPEYIMIKAIGQDSTEVHFRVKYGTSMTKLKKLYANKTGVAVQGLRFLFNGRRINDEDTPKTLKMEDGELIEVYREQYGGATV